MRYIRGLLLWGLFASTASSTLLAQVGELGDPLGGTAGSGGLPSFPGASGASFPGSSGGYPAGSAGYPDGSGMRPGQGPGSMGSGTLMKPQLVRRTVIETHMVPVSPEELAESQEYQSTLAALRAEDRTPEQKAAAKEALAKLVEKQFDRDLATREKEVAELEARTKKLRQQFDKRKAAKAEIIALRLQTLQNEIDGLGFPNSEGTMLPSVSASGVSNPNRFDVEPTDGLPPSLDDALSPPATRANSKFDDPNEPAQPGTNLLKNSSFEDGPSGWGTGATPATVEYTVSDTGGIGSTKAARILKTADKYFPIAEWTQRIEYDGKSPAIELSAMVKTNNTHKAILDVLFLDDKEEWIKHEWVAYIGDMSSSRQPLTHDFQEYKGTVAIPMNTKTIVIGLQDYGPGDVYFDDVKAIYRDLLPKEPNRVPRR